MTDKPFEITEASALNDAAEPIEPPYHEGMILGASLLETVLKGCGWTLIVFNEEEDSYTSFVSNRSTAEVMLELEDLLEEYKAGNLPAHTSSEQPTT